MLNNKAKNENTFCFIVTYRKENHPSTIVDVRIMIYYTFSGGEQRRLSFGVALFHNPKIMILDEPTVGMDPVIRQR